MPAVGLVPSGCLELSNFLFMFCPFEPSETYYLHLLRRTDGRIRKQPVEEPQYLRILFQPGRRDGRFEPRHN